MELVDYLRMLRRQWIWVVASVVVLTVVAAAYAMTAPKTYKASTQVFVGSLVYGNSGGDNQAAQSASNYVFDRITTYANLADTPAVTQSVINELKLTASPQELGKQISASVVPDSVLITISVTDEDPAQAAKIANADAAALMAYIKTIDAPVEGQPAPLDSAVPSKAIPPTAPDSPNRTLLLVLGALLGLALGLVVASLRDQLHRSRPAASPAADVLEKDEQVERLPVPPAASLEAALAATGSRDAAKAERPGSVQAPTASNGSSSVAGPNPPAPSSTGGSRPSGL